jgi:diguanylate cyclase (GGDEF)-like protein
VLINSLLTSGIEFDDSEDYLEFRFRLLNVVMLTGIAFTALFVVCNWAGVNDLGTWQLLATQINCVATLGLLLFLRGRKSAYTIVAALLVSINFATYLSALIFVVNDELRVIWFYLGLVVIYVLIGQRAGVLMTVVSIVSILATNQILAVPFSRNAMTTLLISLAATSVVFYAYTSRAISYFERLTETNLKLHELADRDPLTGLLNPRAYYEVANRMIRLAQRTGIPFAVLFIDLDHFKAINDHFGHEAGDDVLRRVAACLSMHMRQSDVLARVGGEEFAVFLPGTNLEGASWLGEKLREAVALLEPTVAEGNRFGITASIGIADHRPSDQSVADIQRRADRAMYQAKNLGRNRIVTISAW